MQGHGSQESKQAAAAAQRGSVHTAKEAHTAKEEDIFWVGWCLVTKKPLLFYVEHQVLFTASVPRLVYRHI